MKKGFDVYLPVCVLGLFLLVSVLGFVFLNSGGSSKYRCSFGGGAGVGWRWGWGGFVLARKEGLFLSLRV